MQPWNVMRIPQSLCAPSTLGTFVCLLVGGAIPAQSPSFEIIRQAAFEAALTPLAVEPNWSHGHLASWTRPATSPSGFGEVAVYDRNGKHLRTIETKFEGAVKTAVYHAAAGPSGELAVAGLAVNASAAHSGFIALYDPQGRLRILKRTTPFAPQRLCYVGDGALWALGDWVVEDGKSFLADRGILVKLDREGRVVREILPAASFQRGHQSAIIGGEGPPILFCMTDRVGILLRTVRQWIEISLDGEILGMWRFEWPRSPAQADDSGSDGALGINGHKAVIGPDGEVLATFVGRGVGMHMRRLDRESGAWIPVDTSLLDAMGISPSLFGRDGDALLMHRRFSRTIAWVRLGE